MGVEERMRISIYILFAIIFFHPVLVLGNDAMAEKSIWKGAAWLEEVEKKISSGNCKQAMDELTESGAAGETWSYARLGMLYQNGRCVTQNAKQAYKYYEMEVPNGNCLIQFVLGGLDQTGQGTDKNELRAALRYKSGVMCLVGVPADFRTALLKLVLQKDVIPTGIERELT